MEWDNELQRFAPRGVHDRRAIHAQRRRGRRADRSRLDSACPAAPDACPAGHGDPAAGRGRPAPRDRPRQPAQHRGGPRPARCRDRGGHDLLGAQRPRDLPHPRSIGERRIRDCPGRQERLDQGAARPRARRLGFGRWRRSTIEVVSTGGVVLFREVGGKIVASPGQVTRRPIARGDELRRPGRRDHRRSFDAGRRHDRSWAWPPRSRARRAMRRRSACSGSTSRSRPWSGRPAASSAPARRSRSPTPRAPRSRPSRCPTAPGGNTYPGTAPIPSHPDWHVRLVSPVAFGSPSLPLFALLGLAIVVLLSLVVWMAKQILRPAEQLETSRVRLNDLYQLARVDSLRDMLTGLGNHRAFQEEADRQIDASRRYGAPLAVVTINIDDFKAMNDRLGHEGGDGILARFGELIQGSMRSPDRAFRTGADGFAILLPHTDADGGEIFARRLLGAAPRADPRLGGARRDLVLGRRLGLPGAGHRPAPPDRPGRSGDGLGQAPRPDDGRDVRPGPPSRAGRPQLGGRGVGRGRRDRHEQAHPAGLPADRRPAQRQGHRLRRPGPPAARVRASRIRARCSSRPSAPAARSSSTTPASRPWRSARPTCPRTR